LSAMVVKYQGIASMLIPVANPETMLAESNKVSDLLFSIRNKHRLKTNH
jgi:hypothetical protein